MPSKKISVAALLLSVALIIGVIESLVPPIIPFLPYVRIGLSNAVIIVVIILLNYKYAIMVSVIKSVLVPLFVGNPVMILYSLPASLFAAALGSILLYSKKISIPSSSILSAIVHNLVQLCVAALMTNSLVFGYAPYFVIIGGVSGLLTGVIAYIII
ncbi:MAG: Gx transporter family protein, partial [Clostridia bacterium]|nr:Gx transporter family protein [Clostridia bacterium]